MKHLKHSLGICAILCLLAASAFAADRPNILIIFPDDVGWENISAYSHGVMGYRTPNIDRIAHEGALFTDHYAQPSFTAGRAALITGQYPIRSGMTTVGRPGGALGLQPESPTLAEVLKGQGYPPGNLGKTIWVTATSTCPPYTASTNFSAICTT